MLNDILRFLLRWAKKRFLVFAVNILGLSIGITSVLFITVYSIDELSYDKHFQNHDRIYRVVTEYQTNSNSDLSTAESFLGIAPTLKREFAEVEEAVRVLPQKGAITVLYKSGNNKVFDSEHLCRVDKEFFNIFKHSFLYGNETALVAPNSIVLTETLAKKLFGENSPLNKLVIIDNQTYGVKGVINDLPRNSDLYYEALLSHDFSKFDDDWGNPAGYTYVLMNTSNDATSLEDKLNKIATANAFSFFVKQYNMKSNVKISLQSLTTIHFSKPLSGDSPKGNPIYLKVLITLGVLILVIALFNHSNFSTSFYVERMHELSVRKLMGINKTQLVIRFFVESGIIAGSAFIISVVMFKSFLPIINYAIHKNLSIFSLFNDNALIVTCLVLLLIILAGNFYPIFYSLKSTTIQGLKGYSNFGNNRLRKVLIAGQLTFTTGLIFFTITVHDQLDFIKKRDLGFKSNNVIIVPIPDDGSKPSQLTSFISDLKKDNSIKEVSLINELSFPGSERLGYQLGWIYNNNNRVEANFNLYEIDSLFTHLLDIRFLEGANFSESSNKLSQQAIVNEAFVKMAGFKNPESIVGETIHAFDDKIKIIGVVADFNYQDFQQTVRPLIMIPIDQTKFAAKKMLIKLTGLAGLRSVENSYQGLKSEKPFEYSFLEQSVGKMFEQEETTGQIAEIFSLLAIILTGIGLYTLSSLTLTQRTKEIGIRKILGINQGALVILISSEFLIISLIAFFLAIPIAWTQSQLWLSEYVFKTDLRITTLLMTVLIILVILIFGILTNVFRGTKINPIDLIKNE